MFIKDYATLTESIILKLSKDPHLSAGDLIKKLSKESTCTYQAIYKELKQLQIKGVILKEGGKFSINLVWLEKLADFVHSTQTNYQNLIHDLIPAGEGEKRKWMFSDLLSLDDFWAHALTGIIKNSPTKIVYEWIPHPWFELIHTEKESNFRDMLKAEGAKLYIALSGDEYLDHICEKIWQKPVYTYSFGSTLNLYANNSYVDVIDDYVITLKIPKNFADELDSYYLSVKSKKDFKIGETLSLLSQKVKASATIEKNTIKADKLRKKFIKYFGIVQK